MDVNKHVPISANMTKNISIIHIYRRFSVKHLYYILIDVKPYRLTTLEIVMRKVLKF